VEEKLQELYGKWNALLHYGRVIEDGSLIYKSRCLQPQRRMKPPYHQQSGILNVEHQTF
jgi:hypothetical protein